MIFVDRIHAAPCIAVLPDRSFSLTSAPSATAIFTAASKLSSGTAFSGRNLLTPAAVRSGERPFFGRSDRSASWSASSCMISASPANAASVKGVESLAVRWTVKPYRVGGFSSRAFGSAPCFRSAFTSSTLPSCTPRNRSHSWPFGAVMPFAPFISVSQVPTAQCSGVYPGPSAFASAPRSSKRAATFP